MKKSTNQQTNIRVHREGGLLKRYDKAYKNIFEFFSCDEADMPGSLLSLIKNKTGSQASESEEETKGWWWVGRPLGAVEKHCVGAPYF